MTTFKSAISLCGLSQQEAADFLQVNINTIKSWSSGRANPPRGVWLQLASLWRQIEDAADGAAEVMDLEGIDPRAWNHLEADLTVDPLPTAGAMESAGAMALLMVLAAELEEPSS